jgi:hypothetical protein
MSRESPSWPNVPENRAAGPGVLVLRGSRSQHPGARASRPLRAGTFVPVRKEPLQDGVLVAAKGRLRTDQEARGWLKSITTRSGLVREETR